MQFNSYIFMHHKQYMLTADNYIAYLEEELQFYLTYDYMSLNNQTDYDDDYYAAYLADERIKEFE